MYGHWRRCGNVDKTETGRGSHLGPLNGREERRTCDMWESARRCPEAGSGEMQGEAQCKPTQEGEEKERRRLPGRSRSGREIRDERRMLLETQADAGKSLNLLRTQRINNAQTAVDTWGDTKSVGGRQRRFQMTLRMWMSWKGCGGCRCN